jgi:lipase maturation factor 1
MTVPVAPLPLWLLRWLLFRLMFCSGVVKLASGDATWRALTALQFHYQSQPLPNPLAWLAHHAPAWWHTLSVLQMFAIELVVPFLIVAPRRFRIGAAAAFMVLQVAIALTGNYAFFNLLAVALCVLLLDDRAIPSGWRSERREPVGRAWPKAIVVVLAVVIGLLSAVQMTITFRQGRSLPRPLVAAYSWLAPFQVVNGYGLFAVMTTTRPEIVVEGSEDGVTWHAYELPWKPGDLARLPPVVAPHQPRLDWQMWFAALGDWEQNRWFLAFELRLLEASPPVLALLARDPFDGRRPKHVRALLYEYRFSTPEERRTDGSWWRREERGPYGPVISARD